MSKHLHRAFLIGEISEEAVAELMRELHEVDDKWPECDIELVINSQGGSIIEGLALYSTLVPLSERGDGSHILTTKVRGLAGSMATVILQAGDWRVSGKADITVWHEAKMGFEVDYVSEIRRELNAWSAQDRLLEEIIQERSGIDPAMLAELHQPHDTILSATDALALNLIDEIA